MSFLFVAAGGALGALGRYAISLIPTKTSFPVLTLVTNLIGAILIGFVVGIAADEEQVSQNAVLFWKTGVCGGFTTFSTFSLEMFQLVHERKLPLAVVYAVISVCLCLLGAFWGNAIGGALLRRTV